MITAQKEINIFADLCTWSANTVFSPILFITFINIKTVSKEQFYKFSH